MLGRSKTAAHTDAPSSEPADQGGDQAAQPLDEQGLTSAVARLEQSLGYLHGLVGDDQLDVRGRLGAVEERLAVVEQLLGRALSAGPDAATATDPQARPKARRAGAKRAKAAERKALAPTDEPSTSASDDAF
jgi:hypothetical protein